MTEQQPHEAVDRPDGFELRCTWRGSYGANRSRRQIAMTAPVTQQEAGWESFFFLSSILLFAHSY